MRDQHRKFVRRHCGSNNVILQFEKSRFLDIIGKPKQSGVNNMLFSKPEPVFTLEDVANALEEVKKEGFAPLDVLYERNKIMTEFGWDNMNLLPIIEMNDVSSLTNPKSLISTSNDSSIKKKTPQ